MELSKQELESAFDWLHDKWMSDPEIRFNSNPNEIQSHPAYLAIIGLGPSVIPLIFLNLHKGAWAWNRALTMLTGHDIRKGIEHEDGFVKLNGNIMYDEWMKWAEDNLEPYYKPTEKEE